MIRVCGYVAWLLLLALALIVPSGLRAQEKIAGALEAARDYTAAHEAKILGDFRALLSIPNVADDLDDMAVNARWIESFLAARAFKVTTVAEGGAPYVLAERNAPGAAATLLVYAHFDGQPVAADEWRTAPFEPTLVSGVLGAGDAVVPWDALTPPVPTDWRVYARSAGDDKAPIIAIATALDALDAAGIAPSVNLKLMLDGEEEQGSPTLRAVLQRFGDRLDADLMLFCDGPMHQSRRRQLVFGVRGSMGVQLTVYGANRPLHSGHYGNWAPNPTDALIRLLGTLKDRDGHILVPGYYDDVQAPTAAELAAIAAMPTIDDRLQSELGLARREGGEERIERLMLEPAIIVNGLQAGGVGDQAANVIRQSATASLNLRLVPDQTPETVVARLADHLAQQGFHVVREPPDETTLRQHPDVVWLDARGGYPGFRTALDGPEATRLVRILNQIDGQETLLTPTMGGSLPIHLFAGVLDMPIILLPVANHDNNQHGADENLRIRNLWDAIEIYTAVIAGYSR